MQKPGLSALLASSTRIYGQLFWPFADQRCDGIDDKGIPLVGGAISVQAVNWFAPEIGLPPVVCWTQPRHWHNVEEADTRPFKSEARVTVVGLKLAPVPGRIEEFVWRGWPVQAFRSTPPTDAGSRSSRTLPTKSS